MIRLNECWLVLLACAVGGLAFWGVFRPFTVFFALFFVFTLYFFRDPKRNVPLGDSLLISPADGHVLDVEDVDDSYVGLARRLSIFMSPFDVHVNRSPLAGLIERVVYSPGRKIAAYRRGGLELRERNRFELRGKITVAVEQYAGVFARRIVCFLGEGRNVASGERIGMIKYGSRVDVVMPLNVRIIVHKGDRVVAGETVIGVIDG